MRRRPLSRDGGSPPFHGFSRHRWAQVLAGLALAASVGLYAVDSGHHHHTELAQLLCPVCHVVAHSSIVVYNPRADGFRPIYSFLVGSFAVRRSHPAPRLFLVLRPEPRAPPQALKT